MSTLDLEDLPTAPIVHHGRMPRAEVRRMGLDVGLVTLPFSAALLYERAARRDWAVTQAWDLWREGGLRPAQRADLLGALTLNRSLSRGGR